MPKPKRITARATVNLHGLRAGDTAEVNPDEPRVAGLLRSGLLVNDDEGFDEPQSVEETSRAQRAEKPQVKETVEDEAQPAQTRRRRSAASAASETPPQ